MQNVTQQYLLSQYCELKPLSEGKLYSTCLVRSELDGSLAVKKRMGPGQAEIYRTLQDCPLDSIPKVHSVVVLDGCCTVIEEYIQGETLEQMLEREKTFSNEQVVSCCVQLCDTLEWLHQRGIIHRDIKPSNILIDSQGKVRLIDFDISRAVRPDANRDTAILGTVGYAAPEQFGFCQSDGRTDLYALGVLINVMSTGFPPGQRRADGALGAIVERCIRLDPNDRIQTAAQLRQQLEDTQREIHTAQPRRRWNTALLLIACLAAALRLILSFLRQNTWVELTANLLSSLLCILLPLFLLLDAQQISRRLFFLKKVPPQDRRTVCFVLAGCSLTLGLILLLLLRI